VDQASRLAEQAPAKVNLFLRVVGRRADGFHLLDSLAVFAGAADRLSAVPAADLTLRLAGPGAAALRDDAAENLVLRAARALRAACGVRQGAALVLEKHLPVAAGLGGGSADAAAALRLLVRLWSVAPAPGTMAQVAVSLGADVPVCVGARPARMQGVGELLSPAPALPPFGLLLVNPGVSVRTPDVFRARDAGFSPAATLPMGWRDAAAMATDLAPLANDLEAPARRLCPPIDAALAWLRAAPGCLLARMSGSGATCFAVFATPAAACEARARPLPAGWWAWGGAPTAPSGTAGDSKRACGGPVDDSGGHRGATHMPVRPAPAGRS
jgi:4-diphosphocytidyl-2-C-methyl-D-erythritol kinase